MKKNFSQHIRKGLPGGPNELNKFTKGFIESSYGQLAYPGQNTLIPNANGRITMKGVNTKVLGIDDEGNSIMMNPGREYQFPGNDVYEIPIDNLREQLNPARPASMPRPHPWGFLVDPKQAQGNIVGGVGVNFPKGLGFNATGVLPVSPDPVFKGVGSLGVNQQFGDLNIGASIGTPLLRDYYTKELMLDPELSLSGKYTIPYSNKRNTSALRLQPGGTPEVKQRRGVRKNPDGSVSSHLMRAEYIPERGWVGFPSLFQDSKPYADDQQNWVDMSEEEDWMKVYEEANRREEVYDFGEDKEAALAFGKGSWKDQLPDEYIEAELTDEEIEEYQKGGYIVEELQKGGRRKKGYRRLYEEDSGSTEFGEREVVDVYRPNRGVSKTLTKDITYKTEDTPRTKVTEREVTRKYKDGSLKSYKNIRRKNGKLLKDASTKKKRFKKGEHPNNLIKAAEGMSVAPTIAEDGSVTCPEGYTWNPETRYCEKASPRPEGYTWDESKQKYISDEPVGKTKTTKKVIDPKWNDYLEEYTEWKYKVKPSDPGYDKYYKKSENEWRSEARDNEAAARKSYDNRVEANVPPLDSDGEVISFDEWKMKKQGCYGPYCVDTYKTTETEVYDEKDRAIDRIIPEYSYPEDFVPPEYQQVPVNPVYADYKGLRPPGFHAPRDSKDRKQWLKKPKLTLPDEKQWRQFGRSLKRNIMERPGSGKRGLLNKRTRINWPTAGGSPDAFGILSDKGSRALDLFDVNWVPAFDSKRLKKGYTEEELARISQANKRALETGEELDFSNIRLRGIRGLKDKLAYKKKYKDYIKNLPADQKRKEEFYAEQNLRKQEFEEKRKNIENMNAQERAEYEKELALYNQEVDRINAIKAEDEKIRGEVGKTIRQYGGQLPKAQIGMPGVIDMINNRSLIQSEEPKPDKNLLDGVDESSTNWANENREDILRGLGEWTGWYPHSQYNKIYFDAKDYNKREDEKKRKREFEEVSKDGVMSPCNEGMIYDHQTKNCISEEEYFEKYPREEKINEAILEANRSFPKDLQWMRDYMNSPRYKQMLEESMVADYEQDVADGKPRVAPQRAAQSIAEQRKTNLETIPAAKYHDYNDMWKGKPPIAWSESEDGRIGHHPEKLEHYGHSNMHEISHSTDRSRKGSGRLIPDSDIAYMDKAAAKKYRRSSDWYKKRKEREDEGWFPEGVDTPKKQWEYYKKEYPDFVQRRTKNMNYVEKPTETRARLMEIRQEAQKAGIYNPLTEKVDKKAYKKLKRLKNKYDGERLDPMDQLKGSYSDEELMWMLNNVSQNEAPQVEGDDIQMAQRGGSSNDYIEVELDDNEIVDYAQRGYIVEEIPSYQDGGWNYPSTAGGTSQDVVTAVKEVVKDKKKKEKSEEVYLNDFYYTTADIKYMNDNPDEYCFKGDCLEQTFNAYDLVVGQQYSEHVFPKESRMKKHLNLESAKPATYTTDGYYYDETTDQIFYGKKGRYYYEDGARTLEDNTGKPVSQKTDKWLRSVPYFDYKDNNFTMDSWDVHGQILETGGKNIYSGTKNKRFDKYTNAERMEIYKQIPVGAVIGWSDNGYGDEGASKKSFNREKGLTSSNHSTMVTGYDERGVPLIYDYGKYTPLDKNSNFDEVYGTGYRDDGVGTLYPIRKITNISIPKDVLGKNKEWLEKKKLFKDEIKPLNVNYSVYEEGDQDELAPFNEALVANKNQLMLDLKIKSQDYNKYAKWLNAISMQETGGGTAPEHNLQKNIPIDYLIPDWVVGKESDYAGVPGYSQGLTQLNIDNILNDRKLSKIARKYGITKEADLYDPEKAAIASMIYATQNMNSAKDNYRKGKKKGLTRTFYPNSRSSVYDGEIYNTEEGTTVDFENAVGWDYDINEIQEQFDAIKKGKYKVYEKDGVILVDKLTAGNSDLDEFQQFVYNWNSPNTLRYGDAQGESNYVNKVDGYYKRIK